MRRVSWKGFTGFLMEIIGRRWTIAYALTGSLPGLALMLLAHRAGHLAGVTMVAGGLIIGFTVLSAFTATRVYLSEHSRRRCAGVGISSANHSGDSSPAV